MHSLQGLTGREAAVGGSSRGCGADEAREAPAAKHERHSHILASGVTSASIKNLLL